MQRRDVCEIRALGVIRRGSSGVRERGKGSALAESYERESGGMEFGDGGLCGGAPVCTAM